MNQAQVKILENVIKSYSTDKLWDLLKWTMNIYFTLELSSRYEDSDIHKVITAEFKHFAKKLQVDMIEIITKVLITKLQEEISAKQSEIREVEIDPKVVEVIDNGAGNVPT